MWTKRLLHPTVAARSGPTTPEYIKKEKNSFSAVHFIDALLLRVTRSERRNHPGRRRKERKEGDRALARPTKEEKEKSCLWSLHSPGKGRKKEKDCDDDLFPSLLFEGWR